MKPKFLGMFLVVFAVWQGFASQAPAEPPGMRADVLEAEAAGPPAERLSGTEAAVAPALPPAATAAEPSRLAVPPAGEVKAALAEVQDRFSADYAAAKTADGKSMLAMQLAEQASPDQSPAARTALLREALRLAVEAGDGDVAMDAAEKMIDAFEVDRDAALLEVYQSLLRTASPAAARDLGQSILELADEAMRDGRDEAAEKAVPVLLSFSRKTRDPLLVKAASALKLRLAERAALEGRLPPLRAKLAESPDDPQANLDLGRLLCFTAGNWQEGLPYLANGADTALAAIAKAEAEAGDSADPKTALFLADGWFNWSKGQKGSFQAAAEERSLDYYLAARGHVGGPDDARIAKRITELGQKTRFKGVPSPLDTLEPVAALGSPIKLCGSGTYSVQFSQPNGGGPVVSTDPKAPRYTVQGKEWPHSFCLQPDNNGTSIIRFEISGKYRRLQGRVGIFTRSDTPDTRPPASPIVFTVVGDGKPLWRSPPLAKRDQVARFSADISGVNVLELHTTATGFALRAYGAWLDPELVE